MFSLAEVPEWIIAETDEDRTPIEEVFKGSSTGSRNEALARAAGSVIAKGYNFEDALQFCLTWNTLNNPPLLEKEVTTTVKSIWQKHQRGGGKASAPDDVSLQDGIQVFGSILPFALKSGRELQSLNIKIEWLVEGVIPRGAVILLYGRGGIGKTTLIMMIADAIDRGETIFGMATVKAQVIVIDFENSLAVLSERAKRTAVDGVLFWDSGQNPPSLDKADWTAYQALLEQYPGAVLVFDTLRSAHSGDENNSEVMTLIMRRMRQLRDAGATVILLHHTPKGNDRQFKGSGAIFDLCDQTLALYQTAKPGSDQEADDDDDDPDKVYRFGTGKKTRYRPHRVFLSFDSEQEVFILAKNPDDEALEYLHSIVCQIHEKTSAKQTEIVKTAISDGGFDFGGDKKIRALLKRGTGRFWTTDRGLHNSIIYRPIQFGSLAGPIGGEKLPNRKEADCQFGNTPEKQVDNDTPQSTAVVEFGSLAKGVYQTEKPTEIEDAEFPEIAALTEDDFDIDAEVIGYES